MPYYAGIGSRETPIETLRLMTRLAKRLEELNFTLRSGGADGADTAFEQGVISDSNKQIFLPWKGFNGSLSPYYHIPDKAFALAEQIHPAWERCSQGAQKLHARNCQQILGNNLDTPVRFVICWHQNSGGTMQAVRLAKQNNIPVINLADPNWKIQLTPLVYQNK